jgi:hypothetical protein
MGSFHAGVRNDGTTGEFDGFSFPHSREMQSKKPIRDGRLAPPDFKNEFC